MSSFLNPRGRELQWPTPWPGIGLNWYGDCREHRPPNVPPALKARVLDALPSDAMLTFDEVVAATDADPAALQAALYVLCDRDRSAVCISNSPDDGGPYFCKARAGGAWADYTDVYTARVGKAAPAA